MPEPLRLRVLCADDNADGAESLATLLEIAGATVRVCLDGAEAMNAAEEFAPDVALLDLDMPRADGFAVARWLRASAEGRPFLLVAVTGSADPDCPRRTTAAGFDYHFTKPADPATLLAILTGFAASLPPAVGR